MLVLHSGLDLLAFARVFLTDFLLKFSYFELTMFTVCLISRGPFGVRGPDGDGDGDGG